MKPIFTDKSPAKLRESYIKKHRPDVYDFLLKNYPSDISFSEKLHWFFNDINEYPICKKCGNRVNYKGFTHGYYDYCSLKCSNSDNDVKNKKQNTILKNSGSIELHYKNIQEKSKQTKLERYGDENYTNNSKREQTCLERYGYKTNLITDENREKSKQTKLERYGDENYTNNSKREQTCLERYGNIHAAKTDIIKSKIKQTKLERYGDENYNNYDKTIATNLKKYGVKCIFESRDFQEKIKQSMLEKYNVEYAQQNLSIKEKSKITSFNNTLDKHNNILNIYLKDSIIWYDCQCPHPECKKCDSKTFSISSNIYWNRINDKKCTELCTNLLPIQKSISKNTSLEIFIKNILDEHNILYIENDRTILNDKEIDIYIPDKKIGIECNGVYWHSDKYKSKTYHYDKYIYCKQNKIQLLTIWEDQVLKKPDVIKSIILSKLGIYENRIYARNCKIKEVKSNDAKIFIDNNHLQGYVNSLIKIGLYYNNELVSIMTFGKKRKSLNNKSKNNEWELYRFCNKLNTQIIGGASKLFNHFINCFHPNIIESFSSNDISCGKLYDILGFSKISENPGSYWYVDKLYNRYHRFCFRKQQLKSLGCPDNMSEKQFMDNLGYYRIYDSGQTKFIWKNMNIN